MIHPNIETTLKDLNLLLNVMLKIDKCESENIITDNPSIIKIELRNLYDSTIKTYLRQTKEFK